MIKRQEKGPRVLFMGTNVDKDTKEIVKAISELTKELKRIRKVMESWDKEPGPDDEAGPDKYIV